MPTDSHFDEHAFKASLGSLAAGVSVITTTHKEEAIGITVSSFASLSLNPPLILFSLDIQSRHRAAFTPRKKFAVNILSQQQKHCAQLFASAGKKSWDDMSYHEDKNKIRLLKNSIANISCAVSKVHKNGDHLIIIGKVEALTAVDKDAQPLLYFRRHYHALGDTLV
jgi:flavin reductase (DIM6/NTAB) family NADH-FMN oxidoreductase RutF